MFAQESQSHEKVRGTRRGAGSRAPGSNLLCHFVRATGTRSLSLLTSCGQSQPRTPAPRSPLRAPITWPGLIFLQTTCLSRLGQLERHVPLSHTSGGWMCLMRAHCLAFRQPSSHCVLTGWRVERGAGCLVTLVRALIPSWGLYLHITLIVSLDPTSYNTITLGAGFQHVNFWGGRDKNFSL